MSAVLTPRRPIRAVAARLAAASLAVIAGTSFVVVAPNAPAASAATTSSALTVKWNGDTSSAAQYQPARLPSSPHFGDFDDLSITVSQTTGLIDQAIRVSVAGFAGTKSYAGEVTVTNAQNYLQAMQCWGDPADPDFRETCQWGGRANTDIANLGSLVVSDNPLRVGPTDQDPLSPTTHDVPFRTYDGQTIAAKPYLVKNRVQYDILQYFSPSTTNEITSARVDANGTGYFDFETQSSIQSPQLGCGTAEHLQCWLVVVPRGSHFGGGEDCSSFRDPRNDYEPYAYGRPNSVQGGSPINDQCDYWDNRIVVPLTFAPTALNCTIGSTEVRVIGSQLMTRAMTSWQPSLCQTVKSTFSFSTNPDSVARAQLIGTGTGSPNVAYTGYPVSPGELLSEDERTQLTKTELRYAPVAVSSVVVGFLAEPSIGRIDDLNLSPRLVAKLLTQSYKFLVPSNSSEVVRNTTHLGAVNRTYNYLFQDPDFQQLNPENYRLFSNNPAVVLPGPSGSDAIKQVWRWILADADARSFLDGTPDPWGMTVNPYYLPRGDVAATVPWYLDAAGADLGNAPVQRAVGLANLDGTALKLSNTPLDSFPKDDETLMPIRLNGETSRFDSIQYAPYTENLLSGALQAFRSNPNSKTVWNPEALNSAGEKGAWVSSGTQVPGDKFMITITDSPSAARYSLSTAGLQVPNSDKIVHADTEGMTNALAALQPTSLDTVKQVDPSFVPTNGYPLTIVTYAGVNLSKASSAERGVIASMLKQVTASGQVSGTGLGELPPGYLPLTQQMTADASTIAAEIEAYVPPKTSTPTPTPSPTKPGTTSNYAQEGYDPGVAGGAAANGATDGASNPTETPGVDSASDDRTPVSATEAIGRNGLLIALGIGLVGFLVAPILFRGRGFR